MFQNFDAPTNPDTGPSRLAALRDEIRRAGLNGFLVPRADAHQGENVAPRDERLAWLTGFTGSAGFCAVLMDRAGMFIDGRYRVQVKSQIAPLHFTPVNWPEIKLADWLAEHAPKTAKIGFDMWLHTDDEITKLNEALSDSGVMLWPTDNLIDRIWTDQPLPPAGRIVAHPLKFAGRSSAHKRADCAEILREAGQSAAVLTLPDSIAWLLNIRGSDVARTPVPLAFAILHADDSVNLFTDPAKTVNLASEPGLSIADTVGFEAALLRLTGVVRVDPKTAPFAVTSILADGAAAVEKADDPSRLPKARKNPIEIEGAASAHLRDGAAMVEFLAWLDATAPGSLTEIALVEKLEDFRRATNALQDISFETIAGSGPNGAIIHYRVTRDTDRRLEPGDLVVIDSGGQYLDGTTDITRTIVVGDPQGDQRACFTRVVQGMIAISRARFPKGIAGCHLDALARAPLWLAGQDYDHGTGHGVGAYLSVHEGPQGLSRRSEVPLEPGMILSNEPGYYREGAFGIRIENLIVVQQAPALPGGDCAREMLDFRTLTFVPIDREMIDADMLTPDERDWLNAYHAEVADKIGPRVSAPALDWLQKATAPI